MTHPRDPHHPYLSALKIKLGSTLREVIAQINLSAQGIVFVVDDEGKLLGSISDGDIRRALLAGSTLESRIENETHYKNCVRAKVTDPRESVVQLLNARIKIIPLVDDAGVLVDYANSNRTHQIPIMEPFLNGNEAAYVQDCIATKWISSQGKYVTRFEEDFCALAGSGYPVAVSNGTVALHLALIALDIGAGDEVIVPNLTFAASINTIIQAGATPVLVDVDPHTWCIDPKEIEKAITPATKAIMPVHLYGQPCDMASILSIAQKHHLKVIEDSAESMGSTLNGKWLGTFGDVGTFSFFGNKMVTTGEGGMVLFKEKHLAERAKMLRDHGMSKEKRYWHLEVGYNYRMTNLQAAIGVAQLEQFSNILERKLALADAYREGLKHYSWIQLPPKRENEVNVNWLFTLVLNEEVIGHRDELMKKMLLNGIETRPVFYPLDEMPPYQKYRKVGSLGVSKKISRQGMSLPSSVLISSEDIDRILSVFKNLNKVQNLLGEKA